MSKQLRSLDANFWLVGQRVVRKNTDELGPIVHADGEIKVKWDGGRTRYDRRGVPANVQLKEEHDRLSWRGATNIGRSFQPRWLGREAACLRASFQPAWRRSKKASRA